MSLRYVSHQHYTHVFPDAYPDRTILLFDPRVELSREPIVDRLRELGDERRGADLVIFRGSNRRFVEQVEEDLVVLPEVLQDAGAMILAPDWDPEDPAPKLRPLNGSSISGEIPTAGELRNLEINSLMLKGKAIFEQVGCHYQLPSQKHAGAFIRLADCLYDASDTVRVADWLLPHLSPDSGIVADTGSLLGLLSVTVLEAQERFGWKRLPIVALNHYPDYDHLTEVVRSFGAQPHSRALFVISVSSSGRLAELVEKSGAIDEVVTICQTGDGDCGHVLSRFEIKRWDVDADGRCDECKQLQLLVVDSDSYEVRTDLEPAYEPLDTKIAEEKSEFWEAVDKAHAITLHVERPIPERAGGMLQRGRHMAVHIDIAKLLREDAWFRESVIEKLRAKDGVDTVVIPEHAATQELADIALEAFPALSGDAVVIYEGKPFTAKERKQLRDAGKIMVLDDALITGSTLFEVQREIYEIAQEKDAGIDFQAFVVVSRPANSSDEQAVRRRYGFKTNRKDGSREYHFDAAFKVQLPTGRECSFCAERALLERRRSRISNGADRLSARINQLASSAEGIQEPILPGGEMGSARTVGSFYGELGPKTAFAAAASVAQAQKTGFATERPANTVKLLDTVLVVDAIYDSVLAAGVLRTFDPRDLRYPGGLDQQFNAALEQRGNALSQGALTEIAWAAVEYKLPSEGICSLLQDRSDVDPEGLMLELLQLD